MRKYRALARAMTVAGLSAGLAVPGLGTAWAQPSKAETFQLTCGDTTYTVWGNGQGEWTPVHDTSGHITFVPHQFINFSGTVYDLQGNVYQEFSDEFVQTQGSGKQKNDVRCTYTFDDVSDGTDPEEPPAGYRFVGGGDVTGQVVGHA